MKFAIIVSFLIVIGLIFFILQNKNAHEASKQYKAHALMSENEIEFFERLVKALPEYYIFPQVSLGAILKEIGMDAKTRQRLRNTFSQKRADFVVYKDKTIIAIVELDDRTHDTQNDAKRDKMLCEAGYEVMRYESKAKPSIDDISARFRRLAFDTQEGKESN